MYGLLQSLNTNLFIYTTCSQASPIQLAETEGKKVAIQGDEGVGKTALTRQFSSSEYLGTYDNMTSSSKLTEGNCYDVTFPILQCWSFHLTNCWHRLSLHFPPPSSYLLSHPASYFSAKVFFFPLVSLTFPEVGISDPHEIGFKRDGELTTTTIVHVQLDGEESIMEFIDGADAYQMDDINVDAYIVVFSIVDRNSFVVAKDLARQLRVNLGTDRSIILVANKTDLVRKRQVSSEEARLVASMFDCKYIETSAALNHQVDELVAGTLTQIRHQLLPPGAALMPPPPTKSRSRTPSPVSFFNKLFRRNVKGSASCEGIFMK
ncbi:hypothetical protein Btru_034900 [Bulinus truncatus]|nr:hypothetical protein Btru_034900 [Bulinus truncatus]